MPESLVQLLAGNAYGGQINQQNHRLISPSNSGLSRSAYFRHPVKINRQYGVSQVCFTIDRQRFLTSAAIQIP
jgi:hypothetical protein